MEKFFINFYNQMIDLQPQKPYFQEAWHLSVSVVCVYNNHKLRIYCLVQEGYLEN